MSAEHHLGFFNQNPVIEESACVLTIHTLHIVQYVLFQVEGLHLHFVSFFCIEIVILFVFYSHALQSLSQPVKTTRRDFGI